MTRSTRGTKPSRAARSRAAGGRPRRTTTDKA
jgi:hypothetical protein